jgi:2-phospho-L-lactate guanylyltransferase
MSTWSVVIPVKRLALAKSRLALPQALRGRLALAMAADAVDAALRCSRVAEVVVVSDDPDAVALLGGLGARVIPDVPDAGLNPALEHGVADARKGDAGRQVAVLTADLPALKPEELARALDAASEHPVSVVADAAGGGTTLLTAGPGVAPPVSFGASSLERHKAAGAVELDLTDVPGLRCDADTMTAVLAALRLGVGPHSAAVLATVTGMQATVHAFAPTTRSGSVLLDDGSELPFDAAAFDAGGLRLVRPGQRVRLELVDGNVVLITLATM